MKVLCLKKSFRQSQNATREKLHKALFLKKLLRKLLLKLTTVVNFINILCTNIFYESALFSKILWSKPKRN